MKRYAAMTSLLLAASTSPAWSQSTATGTYLAAAVADVDDVEWSTLEYLDRLRSNAARVTLADAEKKTITLEWRP
jgi:hypothetical protein